MSYRRMEQSRNRWKKKAKNKGKSVRELKKQVKKLTGRLNQVKEELQEYTKPTNGVQATPQKPAKEEKRSPKITGSR